MITKTKKLEGKRILVSGKGGSGKSTLVGLMSNILQERGYNVLALDGDASNPRGLTGLVFGLKDEKDYPRALIDFFGGIGKVTCPVDDPSPLTRVDDSTPIPEKKIDITKEIPDEYFIKQGKITLFQAGKIKKYGQGCDGPVEKVVRDFIIEGDYVNLIDAPAGIEHFGRGISKNINIIVLVVDPTLESVLIAKRVNEFCQDIGMKNFWLVLNKIESEEVKSQIVEKLGELKSRIIGVIKYDPKIIESALEGSLSNKSVAWNNAKEIIDELEETS